MSLANEFGALASKLEGDPVLVRLLAGLCQTGDEVFARLRNTDDPSKVLDAVNATGDTQISADKFTQEMFLKFCRDSEAIEYFVSEESISQIKIGAGPYSIAVDPLDGSNALKFAIPSGSIFCIYDKGRISEDYCGSNAVASGFFVYGMNPEMYFCVGGKAYHIAKFGAKQLLNLPNKNPLICGNAANIGLWPEGWRNFFTKTVLAASNPGSHNMRWFGSLVAHSKAALVSGGLFCYPSDSRQGYSQGHLRLVYEAIPIALIFAAVGGRSTNGNCDILKIVPSDVHQKTPFAFGDPNLISNLEKSIQDIEV